MKSLLLAIKKKYAFIFIFLYSILFLLGIKTLFHGFPDIERVFTEWMDERALLNYAMKFGTLDFRPAVFVIEHPPLYYYLIFLPIGIFYAIGRSVGLFHNNVEFVRFYFDNTHYFFLIGRVCSYVFYWLTAIVIYKIIRLRYNRIVSHITTFSYLLIPRFIIDFSTIRPETLLFLNTSLFFYFFMKYYLKHKNKYLFTAAFFLGVSTATKYNALYLGSIFIPLLFFHLKNRISDGKTYKECVAFSLKVVFWAFLGFFVCNPFFVINFAKYIYNLKVFTAVEVMYYWKGIPAIFGITHLKDISSLMYINSVGLLILFFGIWNLLKYDKKLFVYLFFSILVYEAYSTTYIRHYSPLYYLNPLLPIGILIFSSGINFIVNHKKKFMSILIIFGFFLSYNYFDIWHGLSMGKTYLQEAREFIEKNAPEFTNICITSTEKIPQLNVTKESYYRLLETESPLVIKGHELSYKGLDKEKTYFSIFRKLKAESLAKSPQYNLIRWDENIKTEQEAIAFFKKNNIKYVVGNKIPVVDNSRLSDTGLVLLEKDFSPKNKRVFGDVILYIFKVK